MKTENTKKKNSKSELLSGIIILCVGIIIISIVFPKLYKGNFNEYVKTTATITSIYNNADNVESIFTYDYNGKSFTGKSLEFKKPYVGEKLEIYVDPNKPTNIYYTNDLNRILVMLRLASICIIAISIFFAFKDKSRKVFQES